MKPGGAYVVEDIETNWWHRDQSIYYYVLNNQASNPMLLNSKTSEILITDISLLLILDIDLYPQIKRNERF